MGSPRVGEVAALRVADITLSDRSGMVRIRHGKGLKAREVPLNATARRALKLYLAAHPAPAKEAVGVTTRAVPRFTLSWTNHEQHSFGRWCSCFPSSLRQAAAMKFSLATRSGRKVPLGWGSCIQS